MSMRRRQPGRGCKPVPLPFLDTNVILRYITQDNPTQSQQAHRLMAQLDSGAVSVTTSDVVIIEAVYVLSSRTTYNLSRSDIRSHLTRIISLRGLRLRAKQVHLRALDLYASTNIDFADALIVAQMERSGLNTIISFDRDFDRISGIARVEP